MKKFTKYNHKNEYIVVVEIESRIRRVRVLCGDFVSENDPDVVFDEHTAFPQEGNVFFLL